MKMRVNDLVNSDYSEIFNLIRDDEEMKSFAPKADFEIFYNDPYGEDHLRLKSIDIEKDNRVYLNVPYPADSLEVYLDEELEFEVVKA